MKHEELLREYARAVVELCLGGRTGLAGKPVTIVAEHHAAQFIRIATDFLLRAGALHVHWLLKDPWMEACHVELASDEGLHSCHPGFSGALNALVPSGGVNLWILGSEAPDVLASLDQDRVCVRKSAQHAALRPFLEANRSSRMLGSIITLPTEAEAVKDFPDEVDPAHALERWYQLLYQVLGIDRGGCLHYWRKMLEKIRRRCEVLDHLQIRELHFRGAGDSRTDLKVPLHPLAVWAGGSEKTRDGIEHVENFPGSVEVFTTPDPFKTSGIVQMTRPIFVAGTWAEGLELEFQEGRLTHFDAADDSSRAAFQAFLDSESGGESKRRLGEVALVGLDDSPVYQAGAIHIRDPLLAENAACHIALGDCIALSIKGGQDMSLEELERIGCNVCDPHIDLMISNTETEVVATLNDGRQVKLIQDGIWVHPELTDLDVEE